MEGMLYLNVKKQPFLQGLLPLRKESKALMAHSSAPWDFGHLGWQTMQSDLGLCINEMLPLSSMSIFESWQGVQHKAPAFSSCHFFIWTACDFNKGSFSQTSDFDAKLVSRENLMLQRFCDMLALLLFREYLKQSHSTSEFQTVVVSGVNFSLRHLQLLFWVVAPKTPRFKTSRLSPLHIAIACQRSATLGNWKPHHAQILVKENLLIWIWHTFQRCSSCIRTYIHTSIHTYLPTYMHACMHAYIHTYIITLYIIWARHGCGPPPFQYFSVTLFLLLVCQHPIDGKPVIVLNNLPSHRLVTSKRLPHDRYIWIYELRYRIFVIYECRTANCTVSWLC